MDKCAEFRQESRPYGSRKANGPRMPGSRSGFWNMGHKKILPVGIVGIEPAPDVIPVVVSLRAMFDAINAFKFLDVFVPVRRRAGLGHFCVPCRQALRKKPGLAFYEWQSYRRGPASNPKGSASTKCNCGAANWSGLRRNQSLCPDKRPAGACKLTQIKDTAP